MTNKDIINAAHRDATCQQGPRKGQFKKTCPPMGTMAAAYWQGAMMALNPHKVSIAQLIFMPADQRAVFDAVHASMERVLAKKKAKVA